jgi:starch synthase (maltosyl-transferring)
MDNLRFLDTTNEFIIAYAKSAPGNNLIVVVNLNAWHAQDAMVDVPIEQFGLHEQQAYTVEDLLTGERYGWQGRRNYVRLIPGQKPGHVLRVWNTGS